MGMTAADVARYYDQSIPPSVLPPPPLVAADGATAGAPGDWLPQGAQPPATVAALIAGTPVAVEADPATRWTVGQWVDCADGGDAYWSGTAWVGGVAPAPPSIQAAVGTPGTWLPAGSIPPANIADLAAGIPVTVVAAPASDWSGVGSDQYMQTGTAGAPGEAHWDGTAWVAGRTA